MTRSLQFRLALATSLVLILFMAGSATVLDGAFRNSSRLALRESMLGQLHLLLAAATVDANGGLVMPGTLDLPDPRLAIADSGLYAFVTRTERTVWRSPSSLNRRLPKVFAVPAGQHRSTEVVLADGLSYALMGYGFEKTTPRGSQSFTFFLVAELSPLQHETAAYRQRLWLGMSLVAMLLLASQAFALRWSLLPLRSIAGELAAIESGRRHCIEGRYPAEIQPLTGNINLLLKRERARHERYRNAMADLAHSLKTPLAVLKGAPEHPATLAITVTEQTRRMALIVDRQLQRAAMVGSNTAISATPVRPVTERVLLSLDKVYREKRIMSANEVDSALLFRGDEADLLEVLGNLVDNACKWCRCRVQVQGWRDRHGITLVVHDDGPGIQAASFARLLQRGGRADETAPGQGLGLAVVAEVIDAYRGSISIASSLLGGAAVVVHFLE